MSIQKYYLQTSKAYFTACIASFLLLSSILTACLLLSARPPFALLGVPFLIIAFSQFQGYLSYSRRYKESVCEGRENGNIDIIAEQQILLTLAPAPALKLLLFHPSGFLAGEIREVEEKRWRWLVPDIMDIYFMKRFGLFDQEGRLLAQMAVKKKKVDVFDPEGNRIAAFDGITETGETMKPANHYSAKDHSAMSTDLRIFKEDQLVSRLQKGWMPVEWGKRFSLNTPVLSFDHSAKKIDRFLALAASISYYQYENH